MKPLSYAAAARCENATHPRCKCRCGGVLHGAKRNRPENLPPDDPHHAELPKEDPQTSILEALDHGDVLERLERVRRPGADVVATEQEPTDEEVDEWLQELRDFATRGVRAQRAVDRILEGAS
ncbi:MAG: hypothetical protein AB7T31_15005 [Gemmatimonadales bacterium]